MLRGGLEGAQAVRHEALWQGERGSVRRAVTVCGCCPCRDERGRNDDRSRLNQSDLQVVPVTSGMISTTTSLLERDREKSNVNLKCHAWCRSLSALKFAKGCAYVDLCGRGETESA